MAELDSKKIDKGITFISDKWIEEALEPMRPKKNNITWLKYAGRAAAGLAAAFVLMVGLCAASPAVAAKIPFIGDLFKLVSNKTGYIPANLSDYGAVEVLGETASGDYTLRAVSGYSDGYTIQVGMELIAPERSEEIFEYYEAFAHRNTASVNGEKADLRTVSLFTYKEGRWIGAATMGVPAGQQNAEELSVELDLPMVMGQMKLGGFKGSSERGFKLNFTVKTDRAHEIRFTCDEQDNGAGVLEVLATPSVTKITVERPYWGDVSPAAEDGTLGYPVLTTADGAQIRLDLASSIALGGYDRLSREKQTVDLYFDGVPQETKQIVLKFIGTADFRNDETFAEFAIDLEKQTVAPAGTLAGEIVTYEKNSIIGMDPGETREGLTVDVVEIIKTNGVWQAGLSISQKPGYLNGRVQGFVVELYNAKNELLAVSDSSLIGEPGSGKPNKNWGWGWTDETGGEVLCYMPHLDLTEAAEQGTLPREGEEVTVVIRNQFSGDMMLTDTRVLK